MFSYTDFEVIDSKLSLDFWALDFEVLYNLSITIDIILVHLIHRITFALANYILNNCLNVANIHIRNFYDL